jgi:hypothetical protein
MFGELRSSSLVLKDALAIILAFTFGLDMNELVNFCWEYLLYGDLIHGKFYINVPIPEKESKSKPKSKPKAKTEDKQNKKKQNQKMKDVKYEYIAISGELYLTLESLIKRIERIDNTVSNINWYHEIKHKHEYGYVNIEQRKYPYNTSKQTCYNINQEIPTPLQLLNNFK